MTTIYRAVIQRRIADLKDRIANCHLNESLAERMDELFGLLEEIDMAERAVTDAGVPGIPVGAVVRDADRGLFCVFDHDGRVVASTAFEPDWKAA